jgi:phosphoglycolate phosphatase
MQYQAVIFDLDGTLLDTLADLAGAMNRVLFTRGFPTHPTQAFRAFVGNGATKLVWRALPEEQRTDRQVAACLDAFQQEYSRTWNVTTRPYEGIPEMLDALCARGLSLTVLTNKPQAFAERCVQEFFPDGTFAEVRGQQEGVPLKPDPTSARKAARCLGVEPRDCLYLGDSDVDMQTALRAGMHPVGAAWGFRTEKELRAAGAINIITTPQEMLNLIE